MLCPVRRTFVMMFVAAGLAVGCGGDNGSPHPDAADSTTARVDVPDGVATDSPTDLPAPADVPLQDMADMLDTGDGQAHGDLLADGSDLAADTVLPDEVSPEACSTSSDCNEVAATAGALCVEGTCLPCETDLACQEDESYGALATCDPDGACAVPLTCSSLACGPHQLCQPAEAGQDALCLEACDDGYSWDGDKGQCTPVPNCEPGAPASIASQCEAQSRECDADDEGAQCGDCLAGFVEEEENCRPVFTCEELGCNASGMGCAPATESEDAVCQECLEGFVEELIDGEPACYLQTCDKGVPGSIAEECQGQYRSCQAAAAPQPAACGGCFVGYKEVEQECQPVKTCADLDCGELNKLCTPATDTADAVCSGCKAGFQPQGSFCIKVAGATCEAGGENSIAYQCANENRECVEEPGGASCGACVDGFADGDGDGQCDLVIPCDQLECESQFKVCVEGTVPYCGACMSGYKDDPETGLCTPIVDCDDLGCADKGMACAPASGSDDAYCFPACPEGHALAGKTCIKCFKVCGDEDGEDGALWPVTTKTGKCVCRTSPGYYYYESNDVGIAPCDGDGDGWVRLDAKISIESDDAAIAGNARCTLARIDRIVLENEAGDSHVLKPLASYLPGFNSDHLDLYEADFLDDEGKLQWQQLPEYGGRRLRARELNALTKYCVKGADYNGNKVLDVDEWQDESSAMMTGNNPLSAFAYFGELNRGWYVAPEPGKKFGRFVIREKSRLSTPAGDQIAIGYDVDYEMEQLPEDWLSPDAGPEEKQALVDTLRECTVWPSPAFDPDSKLPRLWLDFARFGPDDPSMDFARLAPPEGDQWDGMNHHSQFRCTYIVSTPPDEPEKEPHKLTKSQFTADDELVYQMNFCGALGTNTVPQVIGPVTPEQPNPYDPMLQCDTVGDVSALKAGDVGWVAVRYRPGTAYEGGCINQCWASRGRCGLCGLGTFINQNELDCGPGNWEAGAGGMAASCRDISLPPETAAEDVVCDDLSPDSTFLYVSGALGSDDNPGTRDLPFKTLSAGVEEAAQRRDEALAEGLPEARVVVVGGGDYEEAVALQQGVSIYGRFANDVVAPTSPSQLAYGPYPQSGEEGKDGLAEWLRLTDSEGGALHGSRILSDKAQYVMGSNGNLVALTAEDIAAPTLVEGLTVETVDAPALGGPGLSNLAVVALRASGLSLVRVHIIAGNGADGASGEDGSAGAPGSDGGVGSAGTNQLCPDSAGGQGGATAEASSGQASPTGAQGGTGGAAGGSPGLAGTNGNGGPMGQDGTDGSARFALAENAHLVYLASGEDGDDGRAGQGAGGGGGFAGIDGFQHGGGGGAGGCGGQGAGAGLGGGASIGLVNLYSPGLTLEDCTITTGMGGHGGTGGSGGLGGLGGLGGEGEALAGRGGDGGVGGSGGDGGSGAGGPSIGIYHCWPGQTPFYDGDADITLGQGGASGLPDGPTAVAVEHMACALEEACAVPACDSPTCEFDLLDETPCSDGNECTGPDLCSGGLCLAGAFDSCDDDNLFTMDTCTPEEGCANPAWGDVKACPDVEPGQTPWTALLPYGCYQFVGKSLNHAQARQACIASGGALVRIDSPGENEAVANHLTDDAWIGLVDHEEENTFEWEPFPDGQDGKYWSPEDPDDAGDNDDCVAAYAWSNGRWTDQNCNTAYSYLCERPLEDCEEHPGWKAFEPYGCFRMFSYGLTWGEARRACWTAGGWLADFDAPGKNCPQCDLVDDYFYDWVMGKYYWIGLYEPTEDESAFVWSSRQPITYWNWKAGAPNDYGSGQDCVRMEHSGEWNDVGCTGGYHYVCEHPILACPDGCDDGNPCTVDGCDPAAGCLNSQLPDGTGCDDRDPCTSGDQCVAGVCTGAVLDGFCDNFDDDSLNALRWQGEVIASSGKYAEDGGLLKVRGHHYYVGENWVGGGSASVTSKEKYNNWEVDVVGGYEHSWSCSGWSLCATDGGSKQVCLAGNLTSGCSICSDWSDSGGHYRFARSGDTVSVYLNGDKLRDVSISTLGSTSFNLRLRAGRMDGDYYGGGYVFANYVRGY